MLGLMGGSVVVVFLGGVVGVFFSQRQGLADCFFVSFFFSGEGVGSCHLFVSLMNCYGGVYET